MKIPYVPVLPIALGNSPLNIMGYSLAHPASQTTTDGFLGEEDAAVCDATIRHDVGHTVANNGCQ